jgi:Mor family transcriptional regulator
MSARHRSDDILADMADFVAELLRRHHGLTQEEAQVAAESAMEAVRLEWGGSMCYFKKGGQVDLQERDEEIYSRFNGRNAQQLCRQYGLSERRIYQVIAAVRARRLLADRAR